jgi:hypothetical protein
MSLGEEVIKTRSDRKWFSNCMDKNTGNKNIFSSHMVKIDGAEKCVSDQEIRKEVMKRF